LPVMPLPSWEKSSSNGQGFKRIDFSTASRNAPGAASARYGSELFRLPQIVQSASVRSSRITSVEIVSACPCEQFVHALGWLPSMAKPSAIPLSKTSEYFDTLP